MTFDRLSTCILSPPRQRTQVSTGPCSAKILLAADLIKNSEDDGGIEVDKITLQLQGTSPEIINQEIKKLLEEGIIFEPRPGKMRWLG